MTAETALLIDFGSTYTKLRAVNLESGHIFGSGQGPSTVTTDVNLGLDTALRDLEADVGTLPAFKHRLASSSAAGGLAMITVGLVKELTAEAARLAALGAGAKLIDAYAYKLSNSEANDIVRQRPDILLLAGGTDGGNSETILWNADKLAHAKLDCPVVVAGNKAVAQDVGAILERAGIDVRPAGNVMPEFNVLDVEPARAAIRDVFIDRIVHAKGIDKAAERFDAVLMPTPAAVIEGARLLADGIDGKDGLGPLMVIDVGGATTDVHSIADGTPAAGGVITYGLPEPYAKRTVEGDLGMRHNARVIVELQGLEAFAQTCGFDPADIERLLVQIEADVERLPSSEQEHAFDKALASLAVSHSVFRHVGRIEVKQSVTGPVTIQYGKDLTGLETVIGTGGVLVHGGIGDDILSRCRFEDTQPDVLAPKAPRLLLDRAYLLYAVGLLAEVDPEAALQLARNSLIEISSEPHHDRSPAA